MMRRGMSTGGVEAGGCQLVLLLIYTDGGVLKFFPKAFAN
jgi:hypothetical protein